MASALVSQLSNNPHEITAVIHSFIHSFFARCSSSAGVNPIFTGNISCTHTHSAAHWPKFELCFLKPFCLLVCLFGQFWWRNAANLVQNWILAYVLVYTTTRFNSHSGIFDRYLHFKYIQRNFYTFYKCPSFHCNFTVYICSLQTFLTSTTQLASVNCKEQSIA